MLNISWKPLTLSRNTPGLQIYRTASILGKDCLRKPLFQVQKAQPPVLALCGSGTWTCAVLLAQLQMGRFSGLWHSGDGNHRSGIPAVRSGASSLVPGHPS